MVWLLYACTQLKKMICQLPHTYLIVYFLPFIYIYFLFYQYSSSHTLKGTCMMIGGLSVSSLVNEIYIDFSLMLLYLFPRYFSLIFN